MWAQQVAAPSAPFCRKRVFLSIVILVLAEVFTSAATRGIDCRYNAVSAPHDSARMKLHHTTTQQYQTITAYETNSVEINLRPYTRSLLVLPEVAPADWPVDAFDALTAENFEQIEAQRPDVVILGTGPRQRFVHPRLITGLTTRRIGVECMDNQAACRTYNILMAEGRKVALALIFTTAAD